MSEATGEGNPIIDPLTAQLDALERQLVAQLRDATATADAYARGMLELFALGTALKGGSQEEELLKHAREVRDRTQDAAAALVWSRYCRNGGRADTDAALKRLVAANADPAA